MIDFKQVLRNPVDNSEMTENIKGPDGKPQSVPFTLSRACINALLGSAMNEQQATGEEHLHRWLLAQRINNVEAELSAEDISLIKARVSKMYAQSLVVGQVLALLDPAAVGALIMGVGDKKPKRVA